MLDRITDRSMRDVYDAVRSELISRHGPNGTAVHVFDATVSLLLDGKHDVQLEEFLQSQWDHLN